LLSNTHRALCAPEWERTAAWQALGGSVLLGAAGRGGEHPPRHTPPPPIPRTAPGGALGMGPIAPVVSIAAHRSRRSASPIGDAALVFGGFSLQFAVVPGRVPLRRDALLDCSHGRSAKKHPLLSGPSIQERPCGQSQSIRRSEAAMEQRLICDLRGLVLAVLDARGSNGPSKSGGAAVYLYIHDA
jgi:hypothetical protein